MRAPFQVLVIPYKFVENDILYGIFLRKDMKIWQAISGGGEDSETPIEAARRESNEEANISYNAEYINLDSVCSIPVENVTGKFTWGEDVYVVKEYTFGVNVTNENVVLSHEHDELRWLKYDEAKNMLKYDSNVTALWELNKRLNRIKTKKIIK